MFFTKRDLTDLPAYEEIPEEATVAAPFSEAFKVYDDQYKEVLYPSGHYNLYDAYDQHNKRVKELTGDDLPNPEDYNRVLDVDQRKELSKSFDAYKGEGGDLGFDWFQRKWYEDDYRKRLEGIAHKHPDKRGDLIPERSFRDQGLQIRRDYMAERQAMDLRTNNPIGWAAYLLGSVTTLRYDPIMYMTMPFGFPAGVGVKSILMAGAKNGAINATTELGAQLAPGGVMEQNRQAGIDYTTADALTVAGMAGLAGFGLDVGVRSGYRGIRTAFGHVPVVKDGIVVGWRPKGETAKADADPVPEIAPELAERAKAGDKDAQEEIARIIEGKPEIISNKTMAEAVAGDSAALRKVYEEGAKTDPVTRTMLDVMDADDRLAIKPSDAIDDASHAATITQAIRHVNEPDAEPFPVRVDEAVTTPGVLEKLEGEIAVLKAKIETHPDNVELKAQLMELNEQIKAIDRFGSDPVGDALRLRENPAILTTDIDTSLPNVRRTRALASLSDKAFEMVQRGDAPPELGHMVADFVAAPEMQAPILADLVKMRPVSPEDGRRMLNDLLNSPEYTPKTPDMPGPVAQAARSPRLMDDPYGPEAKAQVQRLEQELREELEAAGRPPPDEMLATPEGQAAAISRADEALNAIRELTGIVPPEVKVQVFSRIDDLPAPLGAKVRAANAQAYKAAFERYQAATSLLERARAREDLDAAMRGEGIEGIADDLTIYVAAYAMNPKGRMAHEVVHALKTTGRLSPEEVKVLADAAAEAGIFTGPRADLYRNELAARFGNDEAKIASVLEEEAAAHYVEAVVRGELPEAPAPETVGIIERLKQLFAQIRNALIGKGFRVATGDVVDPAQEVVSAILSGRVAQAEQRAEWFRQNPGARIDVEGHAAMQAAAARGVELPDGTRVNGVPLYAIRAYHGSPHDFDKFSMEHIGKGEGAQAYGHGLYFAESEGVARSYRDLLTDGGSLEILYPDGRKSVPGLNSPERYAAYAVREKDGDIGRAITEIVGESSPLAPILRGWRDAGVKIGDEVQTGHLYQVRINAEPEQFLDWDLPLSQQSEGVRRAMHASGAAKQGFFRRDKSADDLQGIIHGRASYRDFNDPYFIASERLRSHDGNRASAAQSLREDAASKQPSYKPKVSLRAAEMIDSGQNLPAVREQIADRLREAGVPGIRYLDQGSRGKGEGTYNYVVFDDRLIEITHKNGVPVQKPMPVQQPVQQADIQSTFADLLDDIQAYVLSSPSVSRDASGNVNAVRLNGQTYSVSRGPDGEVTGISVGRAPEGGSFAIERGDDGGIADIVSGNPELMQTLAERVTDLIARSGSEIDNEAANALVSRVMASVVSGESFQDAIAREVGQVAGASEPLFAMRSDGRIKPGAEQRAQDLDADLKDIENALKGANIDDREALQRKRAALLNSKAGEALGDDIAAFRDPRGERDDAMAFLRSHETAGRTGFTGDDLVSLQRTIMNQALEKMAEPIWFFRKGALTGDLRRKVNTSVAATMKNMIREAAGENTGDAAAKKFAKAWIDTAEWLRQSFNAAGGDIGKLKGWFAPQYHNAEALLRAGRDDWVGFLKAAGMLDREKLTTRDGRPLNDKELEELLNGIWWTITTDGANKADASAFKGKGALYKRHAEHRVLHFKNADAFMKYADAFGSGDMYAMMIGHISMMARDIAALRRFGANPELVRERMKAQILNTARMQKSAASLYDELKQQTGVLKKQIDGIKGPLDEALDKLARVHRDLEEIRGKKGKAKKREALREELWGVHQDMKDLLSSKPLTPEQIQVFDEIQRISDEMTDLKAKYSVFDREPVGRVTRILARSDEIWKLYTGSTNTPLDYGMAAGMQGFRNIVGASTLAGASISAITDQATGLAARAFIGMPVAKQIPSFLRSFGKESRQLALQTGLGLDQAHHAFATQSRFAGWINTRSFTGYLADRTHALSFLSPMTQAAKTGFGWDFMTWMAALAKDKAFADLEPWTKQMLKRHGWQKADWESLRGVVPEDIKGVPVMTRAAIANQVSDDLADKYMRTLLRERSMAVLEPTLEGRAIFVSESKPGTIMGEITRSVAMLKSFPTTYALLIIGRMYDQVLAGRWRDKNALAFAAAILVGGTTLGALVKQMKNVAYGRDPEDMQDPQFWGKAFMQSGGLGIYGDFIGNSINRTGGGVAQTIMGPTADRAANLFDLTIGNAVQYAKDEPTNFGREAVKFARQNTPVLPFYLRQAYERMLLDEIQKAVDPAAHRSFRTKIRAQKKLGGNDFYWPPGSPRPQRAPDLGAAFGSR